MTKYTYTVHTDLRLENMLVGTRYIFILKEDRGKISIANPLDLLYNCIYKCIKNTTELGNS